MKSSTYTFRCREAEIDLRRILDEADDDAEMIIVELPDTTRGYAAIWRHVPVQVFVRSRVIEKARNLGLPTPDGWCGDGTWCACSWREPLVESAEAWLAAYRAAKAAIKTVTVTTHRS